MAIGLLGIFSLISVEIAVKGGFFLQKGGYHLPIFIMFFWILPIYKWDVWLWIATSFLWISVLQVSKAEVNSLNQKAVFNAGFWLVIATFFRIDFYYFFITLWGVLYIKGQLNFKTIFISFLPALCLFIVVYTASFLIPSLSFLKAGIVSPQKLSFTWTQNLFDSSGLFLIILTLIMVVLKHFQGHFQNRRNYKTYLHISLLMIFTSLIIVLFGGEKNGVSWISLLMITAILSAPYFETLSKKWIDIFFILCFCFVLKDQLLILFS